MATTDSEPQDEDGRRWEGYTDYRSVSARTTQTVHNAIEAAASVERAHKEGVGVDPELAARAGADILAAAIKMQTELARYQDNDEYADLYESFSGDGGYVERMRTVSLRDQCPDWMLDFVVDIRRAGFELGYLAAGREESDTENTIDQETEQMLQGQL